MACDVRCTVWAVVLAVGLGCGPETSEAVDDSTGSAADAGDDTATTGDGSASETGLPPGDDSGEPPIDACEPIRPDDGEPQPVTITIRNDRAETIFVGFGDECVTDAFRITGPDGEELDTIGPFCTQSCEEVIASGCSDIDCGACAGPELVQLPPGTRWEGEWSGVVSPGLEIPDGCGPSPCSGVCRGRHLPDPGAHLVRAVAFSTCTTDGGVPCPPCDDPTMSCAVWASFESDFAMPEFQAEATLELPGTSAVELTFVP